MVGMKAQPARAAQSVRARARASARMASSSVVLLREGPAAHDPAVGVEGDDEIHPLPRHAVVDEPAPDLLLFELEELGFGRPAQAALDFQLAHALRDAGEVGLGQDLFDAAQDLVGADGGHEALDALGLTAVFPGDRAILVGCLMRLPPTPSSHPSRLSHSTRLSSLYYIAISPQLSFVHMGLDICQCHALNSS